MVASFWFSLFDVFCVISALLFSVEVFWPQVSIVCVCARAAGRICCILEVVILLFSVVLDSGLCAQFLFCCVRCINRSVTYC